MIPTLKMFGSPAALAKKPLMTPSATPKTNAMIVETRAMVMSIRGAVLQMRNRTFVEAARCAGNSELRVAFIHVMPNSLAPALVHFSTTIGFSILLTAGLSFVGAGVPPPTPELGLMIQAGAQNMMTGHWWTALFPGLALALTVLGFSLFGDNLRVYLDPVNRR